METLLDTRVTYFRTSLDQYDLYYMDRPAGELASAPATPAVNLMRYLYEANPNFSWQLGGESMADFVHDMFARPLYTSEVARRGGEHTLVLLDAVVLDSGDEPVVVAGLVNIAGSKRIPPRRSFEIPAKPHGNCIVTGSSLPMVDRTQVIPLPDDVWESVSAAYNMTQIKTPCVQVRLAFHEMYIANTQPLVRRESTVASPELAGFRSVLWDSPTWHLQQRPSVASDMLAATSPSGTNLPLYSSDDDTFPAIVSSVLQAEGHVPVVTAGVEYA